MKVRAFAVTVRTTSSAPAGIEALISSLTLEFRADEATQVLDHCFGYCFLTVTLEASTRVVACDPPARPA